jgi:surface-anchored protein
MIKLTTLLPKLTSRQGRARRTASHKAFPNLETLEDRRLLSHKIHDFTNQHTDLDVTYNASDGKLHLHENNKAVDPIQYYNTKNVLLEFLPEAKKVQTSDSRFAFTGAQPGDPIWIVPISPRDPNLLQLGVSGERINSGVLGSYQETDPRLSGDDFPFPWIRLDLIDIQGPGYFSVWQTDSFGTPTVWIATAGNPNSNTFFAAPGGHVDYNWAFTQPGDYYVDFQASAILPDGTPVQSRVTRYHFQVDDTPGAPAPGTFTADAAAFSQVGTHTVGAAPSATLPSALGVGSISGSLLAAPVDQLFASTGSSQTDSSASLPLTSQAGGSDLAEDVLGQGARGDNSFGTLH